MLVNFETDSDAEQSYLTRLTDDEIGETDNTFVNVKTAELMWNGWDPEYKVVSVLVQKFVNLKRLFWLCTVMSTIQFQRVLGLTC